MPEHEFDLYLSLLSRFLRLKPAQRDEIADELRDHLEARLEELAQRGLSRSEAIRTALDEFGDAAELARHFTHVAHIRKRRIVMRLTFGTVAVLVASLLVAIAFWPESPQAPAPRIAIAQAPPAAPSPGGSQPEPQTAPPAGADGEKAAVEAKLAQRLEVGDVQFDDLPLTDAMQYISQITGVDILFDRAVLTEEGVALDQPVQLVVRRTSLSARAVLDLVLEPIQLGYTVRDGLILITTAHHADQIQVYNILDLLRDSASGDAYFPRRMQMGGFGVGGGEAGGGRPAAAAPAMPGSATAGVGLGGGGLGIDGCLHQTGSLALLIATTINPESWEQRGGGGSIVQYHELLVVKNNQAVHAKIKSLLEMMRASSREKAPQNPAAAPVGISPPAGPAAGIPFTPATGNLR
jgi:hypothetical protein